MNMNNEIKYGENYNYDLISNLPIDKSQPTESELLFLPTVKFIAMIQFHPLIAQAIVDNLIDLVLRLPNYKIKSENTRALLEKRLIKPDLESMQALCMAIRQNNKSAALT